MEFYQQLLHLFKKIHDSHRFADVLPTLEHEILHLFDAERMTIYQRNRYSRDIVSRFKTGTEIKEIRLPIGPQSLAGYVALSKRPLLIKDAYDDEALKTIHPKLKFARRYDKQTNFRTKSVLIVPIQDNDVLLGVIQFINRVDGTSFTESDARKAIEMSSLLGQKFRYELGGTKAPFDYLYHLGSLVKEQLEVIHKEKTMEDQLRRLREEFKVNKDLIGLSLEVYYQVPFLTHDDDKYHIHHGQ